MWVSLNENSRMTKHDNLGSMLRVIQLVLTSFSAPCTSLILLHYLMLSVVPQCLPVKSKAEKKNSHSQIDREKCPTKSLQIISQREHLLYFQFCSFCSGELWISEVFTRIKLKFTIVRPCRLVLTGQTFPPWALYQCTVPLKWMGGHFWNC